ncbi:MAG: hypothetical protein ACYTHJ_08550 [Planctomycetota bacterium]|jgi:hypothetical protein
MQARSQHQDRRFSSIVLKCILVLTCLRVWLGPIPWEEKAYARLPDSGLQRKQMLDQAMKTNEILTRIERLLKTHTFKVAVEGADNSSGRP